MTIDVNSLRKGDKLFTKEKGGYAAWYPYVKVLGEGEEAGTVSVEFSDGDTSAGFRPNGAYQFELLKPKSMVNK